MNKRLIRKIIILLITLQFFFTTHAFAQQETLNSPVYDSVLLKPERLNMALSGMSDIDFSVVKNELLLLQSDISQYPKHQQVQFWYYLAICGWKLSLPSDQVLPYLDIALSIDDSIENFTLFKMLMQAKDIARDYRYFNKVIDYIDKIKQLVGENSNPEEANSVSPVDAQYAIAHYKIGDHDKAIELLNNLFLLTEMAGDKPIRYWFQVLSSAQVSAGDLEGAITTTRKQIGYFPHSNTDTYLTFLEESLAQNSN